MKKLITLLFSCSLVAVGQTGYITESGKRITYKASGTSIVYSNGKVAIPSIASADYKKAYKYITGYNRAAY
jgi:hypothetical protein